MQDGRIGVELSNAWQDPNTEEYIHRRLSVKPCNLEIYHVFIHHCQNCSQIVPVAELFECADNCGILTYCSKRCQKEDWYAGHKDECERLKKAKQMKHHADYPENAKLEERFDQFRLFGDRYAAKGKYAEAVREYRKIKRPDHVGKFTQSLISPKLAHALSELGRFDEARQVLEDSIHVSNRRIWHQIHSNTRRIWRKNAYGTSEQWCTLALYIRPAPNTTKLHWWKFYY